MNNITLIFIIVFTAIYLPIYLHIMYLMWPLEKITSWKQIAVPVGMTLGWLVGGTYGYLTR